MLNDTTCPYVLGKPWLESGPDTKLVQDSMLILDLAVLVSLLSMSLS